MSMLRNAPFAGDYPIALHFGEQPDLFSRVSFAGVPLRGHPGIDFALPEGTSVVAVQHGVVLDVREEGQDGDSGYGNSVLVGHRWGQTFYAHLASIDVKQGQQVGAGQQLGLSGQSGVTEEPTLHFGLRIIPYSLDDGWVGFTDPLPYLWRLVHGRGAIIGPHIIGGVRPHLDALSRWRPRLITILDPSADDMLALRDVCPDSTVVARAYIPDQEVNERIRANPLEAAQWADEVVQDRMVYGVDYWQIANEIMQDDESLPLLNDFEVARMNLADEAGYRCAIFGFGVGNPDLPEEDRLASWRLLFPALQYAEEHEHVVAVHQYGMPDLWGPNNAYDWYIYRLEHQVLRRLPFRRLKFAVTEYGIDGLIRGDQPAGWQSFTTPEGYVEQLLKCGRYVERFSGQILGYSIFTLGHHHPWQTYDIAGKTAAYLADLSEKGTWREIDAQVYDIAPRDTDTDTAPGPTITPSSAPPAPEPPIETPAEPPIEPIGPAEEVTFGGTLEGQPEGEPQFGEEPLFEDEIEAEAGPTFDDEATTQALPQAPDQAADAVPQAEDEREQLVEPEAEAPIMPETDESTDSTMENTSFSTPTLDEIIEQADAEAGTAEIGETWVDEPTAEDETPTQEFAAAPSQPIEQAETQMTAQSEGAPEEPAQPEEEEAAESEEETEEEAEPQGPLVDRRIALSFPAYNMEIASIDQRPDAPLEGEYVDADVVYLVKDVFMTYYGSWELSDDYESVPEWARDDYLRPEFLEAGADHHLFAAVIGLDGEFIKGHEVIYWSDGFEQLGNPDYTGYTREHTKDSSGWANLFMAGGSSFVPQRGETGPWCWAPAGAAEVVCGGGLPIGHPVSTFVVWQAVPRAAWEATLKEEPAVEPEPEEPEVPPTEGETPDEGEERPAPTIKVEQRISEWAEHYNIEVKSLAERPDSPSGDILYLVRDIFTTRNGSWEPVDLPGSVPQWARDDYLKPVGAADYFDDAGGDHHLFAAVIGLDGKLVRGQEILFWSDGFDVLADPDYNAYVRRATKERSGWANIITGPGSSFVPERGESGPWCWAPAGAAEVVCGGGLPANHHISFFVVWQAVLNPATSGEPGVDQDYSIYLPTVPSAETERAAPPAEADATVITALRQGAWSRVGIELQPSSPLAAYARREGLGRPVTQEFETSGYRVQGFQNGIVYAPVNDPQRVTHADW